MAFPVYTHIFSFLWEMKIKRTGSLSNGNCKVLKIFLDTSKLRSETNVDSK